MVLASPGVNILEKDQLGFRSAPVSNPFAAAFISTFKKGPLNVPQYINSERQLFRVFGDPPNASQGDYMTLVEYLAYGGGAWVTRIAGEGNTNAQLSTSAAPDLYENESKIREALNDYSKDGTVDVIARTPGSWANNLGLVIYDSGPQYVAKLADVDGPHEITTASGSVTGTGGSMFISLNTAVAADGTKNSSQSITLDIWDFNTIGDGKYIWLYAKDRLDEILARTDEHKNTFYAVDDDGADIKLTITEAGSLLNSQKIPIKGTNLKYSDIGSHPGTTFASQSLNIENDEVHYAIIDLTKDEIVERGTGLSKLRDSIDLNQRSNYYVDTINTNSDYIFIADPKKDNDDGYEYTPKEIFSGTAYRFVGADLEENVFTDVGEMFLDPTDLGGGKIPGTDLEKTPSRNDPVYLASFNSRIVAGRIIEGGKSDYKYGQTEIDKGYSSLDDTINYEFNFIITGSTVPSADGSTPNFVDTRYKINRAVELAESRTDAIALASTLPELIEDSSTQTTEEIIQFFGGIRRSSYLFIDSGVKTLRNRFSRRNITIPCNGDIAGICRRNAINNNAYTSPAGVTRGLFSKLIPQLLYNPNQEERDRLYTNNINPIIALRNSPPVLYGDRTALLGNSPFSDLSVRLFFIDLKNYINQLSANVLFEKNTASTREQFGIKINKYLSDVFADGGISAFEFTVDETNNPEDIVDRGEFVADIFIRPLRSINVITVNLVASDVQTSITETIGAEN